MVIKTNVMEYLNPVEIMVKGAIIWKKVIFVWLQKIVVLQVIAKVLVNNIMEMSNMEMKI